MNDQDRSLLQRGHFVSISPDVHDAIRHNRYLHTRPFCGPVFLYPSHRTSIIATPPLRGIQTAMRQLHCVIRGEAGTNVLVVDRFAPFRVVTDDGDELVPCGDDGGVLVVHDPNPNLECVTPSSSRYVSTLSSEGVCEPGRVN